MTQTLTEDDIYRASSQFRFWSFPPELLASLREQTHELAVQRARSYQHAAETLSDGETGGGELELLTVGEELRLVQRYCLQIRNTCDFFKWPNNVKATSVQYLRRFYLRNSVMTYPPKEVYKTMIFLAYKSEGTHMALSEFARRISTPPELILAPEYKVIQALRFTLDVRHPFRGLKGVLMELLNIVSGQAAFPPAIETTALELQTQILALPQPSSNCRTPWEPSSRTGQKDLAGRVNAAYVAARGVLEGPALFTDAYFLYTPSQIMLSALRLADEPLFDLYLLTKLPADSAVRPKVLATIKACSETLASFSEDTVIGKYERADLEAKLDRCRDPSTRDLVKANAALKRDGDEDGKPNEEKAKRRKLERERSAREGDELFGPSIGKTNPAS